MLDVKVKKRIEEDKNDSFSEYKTNSTTNSFVKAEHIYKDRFHSFSITTSYLDQQKHKDQINFSNF